MGLQFDAAFLKSPLGTSCACPHTCDRPTSCGACPTTRISLADLERARVLAEAMVETGDDPDAVERQLLALGVTPCRCDRGNDDGNQRWLPARRGVSQAVKSSAS